MMPVVFCDGGVRDPRVQTMFHVSNVNGGVIYWINGDEVIQISRRINYEEKSSEL